MKTKKLPRHKETEFIKHLIYLAVFYVVVRVLIVIAHQLLI